MPSWHDETASAFMSEVSIAALRGRALELPIDEVPARSPCGRLGADVLSADDADRFGALDLVGEPREASEAWGAERDATTSRRRRGSLEGP